MIAEAPARGRKGPGPPAPSPEGGPAATGEETVETLERELPIVVVVETYPDQEDGS